MENMPSRCERHPSQRLLPFWTAGVKYCPICRENKMYAAMEALGLSQFQRSSVMDLIVKNYE